MTATPDRRRRSHTVPVLLLGTVAMALSACGDNQARRCVDGNNQIAANARCADAPVSHSGGSGYHWYYGGSSYRGFASGGGFAPSDGGAAAAAGSSATRPGVVAAPSSGSGPASGTSPSGVSRSGFGSSSAGGAGGGSASAAS